MQAAYVRSLCFGLAMLATGAQSVQAAPNFTDNVTPCADLMTTLAQVQAYMRNSAQEARWRQSPECRNAEALSAQIKAAGCLEAPASQGEPCLGLLGQHVQAQRACQQNPARCAVYNGKLGRSYELVIHKLWRQGCAYAPSAPAFFSEADASCAVLQTRLADADDSLRASEPYIAWSGSPECQAVEQTGFILQQSHCWNGDPGAKHFCQAIRDLRDHHAAYCAMLPQRCWVDVSPEWSEFLTTSEAYAAEACSG